MQTLRKLFPFYLRLDRSLQIIERGPSMDKILPEVGNFKDFFRFLRPNFEIEYTFNSIVDFSNQVFILELKLPTNPIRLKGQFIIHHELADELLFCGSPWLMSIEAMQDFDLVVTDFALHDSAIDTILMMNQNLLTLEDSNKMIENLRQKNETLVKTNDRLDSIIYAITHDFRAPLLASIGLLQLPESMITTNLPDVLNTLKKLDRTIIHLNELAKNDKVELKITEIDIQSIIQEIYYNYQIIYQSKIPLTLTIESEYKLYSDTFRIRTILNNLISNAIKYSKPQENANIAIKISVTKENLIIHIIDNGEGIDEQNLKNIFKLFFRASVKSQGSGIGLYVIKEMVRFLNGTISVESIKGEGTTFTVSIPNANLL